MGYQYMFTGLGGSAGDAKRIQLTHTCVYVYCENRAVTITDTLNLTELFIVYMITIYVYGFVLRLTFGLYTCLLGSYMHTTPSVTTSKKAHV